MSSATSPTNPSESFTRVYWKVGGKWDFLNAQTKEHFPDDILPKEFINPVINYMAQYFIWPPSNSLLKFVFTVANDDGGKSFKYDVTGDSGTSSVQLISVGRTGAKAKSDLAACVGKVKEVAFKVLNPKVGQEIGFSLQIDNISDMSEEEFAQSSKAKRNTSLSKEPVGS